MLVSPSSESDVGDWGSVVTQCRGGCSLLEGEACGHPQVLHALGKLLLGVLGVVVLQLSHQRVQHVPGDASLLKNK